MQRPDLGIEAHEVAIHRAAETDAPALASLLGALGYPARAGEVAARLARLATFGGSAVALVAVGRAGEVSGLVTAHAFASVHADAPAAWLTTLVVDPAARGRGIGRRLVRAAETWAALQGAIRVSVSTGAHRAEAHRFYEDLGYAITGHRFTRSLGAGTDSAGTLGTGAA